MSRHGPAIGSVAMSPVEITLVAVCVLLLAVVAAAALMLRRLVSGSRSLERSVDRLREQVEELARRESAREAAEAAGPPNEADWVITFDGNDRQHTVPTQHVVSTTLGEPLIKMSAFSHGVRQALREERRAHLAYQVRREYRRRRRATRARARATP